MSKEPEPRIVYADIIDLPHWQSPTRPHMSLYDRAAQFSSYKALTGYEDMVAEEARLTEEMTEIGNHELKLLNLKLARIRDAITSGEYPLLTFTVFIPDEKKAGGKYVQITDTVKKVDSVYQTVVLMNAAEKEKKNRSIPFENISAIHGELVDYLDDEM